MRVNGTLRIHSSFWQSYYVPLRKGTCRPFKKPCHRQYNCRACCAVGFYAENLFQNYLPLSVLQKREDSTESVSHLRESSISIPWWLVLSRMIYHFQTNYSALSWASLIVFRHLSSRFHFGLSLKVLNMSKTRSLNQREKRCSVVSGSVYCKIWNWNNVYIPVTRKQRARLVEFDTFSFYEGHQETM